MKLVDKATDKPQLRHHRISSHIVMGLFILLLATLLAPVGSNVNAFLSARSVSLGSAIPGSVTSHSFQFDALGAPAIGSVVFEYCDSPLIAVPCVIPPGLNTSSATLTVQTGDTGYSIHPDTSLTNNKIMITRAPVASAAGTKSYQFGNITNPNTSGTTAYVRIFTYASVDGSGLYDDTGSVAFSTQAVLTVNVYVPPYLALCSGVTVAIDCTSVSGDVVDMGELSKTTANAATTQFSVATNSFNGYSALLVGPTMTAGNRTIPALSVPSVSQPGNSQFGVNLRANTAPTVGNNVEGVGTGVPAANYNTPNIFRFQSGDTIASSPLSTEWNRYTISYLVNVADTQPAGRYSSTLTVIATTTF